VTGSPSKPEPAAVQHGRAITFSTVSQGRIVRQVEFWPEPFAPAVNRAHLVEPIS
jgi:hypothetical protein